MDNTKMNKCFDRLDLLLEKLERNAEKDIKLCDESMEIINKKIENDYATWLEQKKHGYIETDYASWSKEKKGCDKYVKTNK